MHKLFQKFIAPFSAKFMGILIVVATLVIPAVATAYTQLQVLLPGEIAAPGSVTGKLGAPLAQTVSVPFAITVRACDTSWNTDLSISNFIELSSSDVSATLPGPIALTNGEANVTVTLNASGSFIFTADDQSDPTIPQAMSSNVTAYVLHGFEFARISQKNQYAGQAMQITVWAVDPVGEIVSGFSGQVRLQEITSFGIGRIEPEVITLSNGSWSGMVTLFRADETSINRGNVNIYALLDSDPSKNGTSDPFTVHPGTFSRLQIVVPGENPLPGSVSGLTGTPATQSAGQTFSVDVYATDDYWNPVASSDQVRITSSDPGASTPVTGSLVGGYRQFTASLATFGSQTLTVSDQTNASIQGMTSSGIMVIASAPDHFEIDPIASPVIAGESIQVTIRAVDVGGNTISDYSGDALLSANTGSGSISPEAVVFVNGGWIGNIEFRGAGGSVAFTCSDYSIPPHMGISNNFEVLPATYAGLQVLLPGQTPQGGTETGIVGFPSDQNAGSGFTVTVRAVDQFWNRVTGINNRILLSSSDPFAAFPAETYLVNGEVVIPATLFKAGSQTISVNDADSTSIAGHTSSPVYVQSGAYTRILLIAPGEHPAPGTEEGRAGTATDQSINYAFNVTVYATDTWWNPITGVTDIVRITSGDPLAELPADTPMQNGEAAMTVRLSTGGFQQITASNVSQPSMPLSTTQVRAISSGFHLEAEVNPTHVQAGEPFDLTVKVTNDAGSVIQEINSLVSVEVQNASAQEPGRGTLQTTEFQLLQGQRTVTETYTYAEPIILIISDDGGNDPAASEVIIVSPGDPARIELSSNPSWVRGNKQATVQALVLDDYDNGVPGQPVLFTLVSGEGTLSPIDSLTNDSGAAQTDFLSPREPGITRIRAASNGLVSEFDLETALVDPNKPAGTITNYPNPFHPGEAPTTIAYKLTDNARVSVRIFSLTGMLVLETVYPNGSTGGMAGLNEITWNGRNGEGTTVASGGYIVVVEAVRNGETIHVMRRKIAVVR